MGGGYFGDLYFGQYTDEVSSGASATGRVRFSGGTINRAVILSGSVVRKILNGGNSNRSSIGGGSVT